MGKLLVLSVSDCEEHIFNRIMAAIIDEPELDRTSVISQIRRKLTPDTPKGGYIRTVLGSGYKFESVI